MCGIVGYIGPRQAYPIIIKGLKRQEYRGYDSAGVALLNGGLKVYKKKGKVAELEEQLIWAKICMQISASAIPVGPPMANPATAMHTRMLGQWQTRHDPQWYY